MSVQFHSQALGEYEREGTELVAEEDLGVSSEVRMYPLQQDTSYRRSLFACPQCTKRELLLSVLKLALFVVLVLAGFLVGYHGTAKHTCFLTDSLNDYDQSVVDQSTRRVDATRIRDTVKQLSKQAHVAGTQENFEVFKWIQSQVGQLRKFNSRVLTYNVLLQHPTVMRDAGGVPRSANSVELLDANGVVVSTCSDCAPQSNGYVPFTAFSALGEFVGTPVYVNFGRPTDFDRLLNASVDCTRKVLIARLGEETRAAIAWRASQKYCVRIGEGNWTAGPRLALLVYPDPSVYPAAWANETSAGVNRYVDAFGDLRTPGLPSIRAVFRESLDDTMRQQPSDVLVQPISWQFAAILMRNMAGTVLTHADWAGKLSGIAFATGPGYRQAPEQATTPSQQTRERVMPSAGYRIRVKVTNAWSSDVNKKDDEGALIRNLIAVVPGSVERDRYVIVGAHYDALTCGARDNGGSVAVLLETMRVLHQLYVDRKWQPRRTIVFAFWDAEKLGQIGSTEFIEEFGVELKDRAVAYVNLDGVVSGTNHFVANEHPLFYSLLADVTSQFDWPTSPGTPIVHRWLIDMVLDFAASRPPFGRIFSPLTVEQQRLATAMIDEQVADSDIVSWWTERGVPFIAPRFVNRAASANSKDSMLPFALAVAGGASMQSTRGTVSVPNSDTDTFETLLNLDPLFTFHASIARIVLALTHRLADSVLLPANPTPFAAYTIMRFQSLCVADSATIDLVNNHIPRLGLATKFAAIRKAFDVLLNVSRLYAQRADQLDRVTASAFAVRRMNERVMLVDHAFETPYNAHFRQTKSSLFAADRAYEQRTVQFPGVRRALDALRAALPNDKVVEFDMAVELSRELSILLVGAQQAARLLSEQDSFLTD